MNIAYVLEFLADRFGGVPNSAKNTGAVLTDLGHTVSFWAPGQDVDSEELSSLECARIFDLNWPKSWYHSKGLAQTLACEMDSIDIVHIFGFWNYPTFAGARVASAYDVPYVLKPCGALEPWRLRSTPLKWLKKRAYLNMVSKRIIRTADCLHADSIQEAEHFRLLGYRGAITIIPIGIDTSSLIQVDTGEVDSRWPDLKDRPIVLFMSRLSPEKGLDLLIPLWAELCASRAHSDALLVIAGPDDRGYQKVVEAMIDGHDVARNIYLTGMVPEQDKFALLKRADIFILPSYSENFGIVVAEALACGTPVITTTGTPWEELQRAGAGRWVLPTAADLGSALRDLLDMSASQRNAMGQRGQRLVLERYNRDTVARQYVTLYDHILHGRDIPLHPEPACTLPQAIGPGTSTTFRS